MADLKSISAAVTSLKAATDIATGLLKLKVSSEIQAKVAELQAEILTAQSSALAANSDQFTLLERVRELEEQIAQFENWETEKQRYQLEAVDRGAFAYVPKPGMQGTEPPHWLCASCFEKRHKSVLQFREQTRAPTGGRGSHSKWGCGSCRNDLTVSYTLKPGKS